jgi:hypothetical protein
LLKGVLFLSWPFVLHFSSGTSLMPLSPLSWPYSWLFLMIPLLIASFAPTRLFTGPVRYAYLEYTPDLASFLLGNIQFLPTLALFALFVLPALPIILFILFPALLLASHYIIYHYRRRLKEITTSATRTTSSLDLAVARARRAAALIHTYEKHVLDTVSITRRTTSLTLTLHSTDFFDTAVSAWAALGRTTAPAQRVAAAARAVVNEANNVLQCESPDSTGRAEMLADILLERANEAVKATSEAEHLAHEAQKSVEQSQGAQSRAEAARQHVKEEAKRVRSLATKLAEKVVGVEERVANVEDEAENARSFLDKAVVAAIAGEMAAAEELSNNAAKVLESVVQKTHALSSVTNEAKQVWVELSVDG